MFLCTNLSNEKKNSGLHLHVASILSTTILSIMHSLMNNKNMNSIVHQWVMTQPMTSMRARAACINTRDVSLTMNGLQTHHMSEAREDTRDTCQ